MTSTLIPPDTYAVLDLPEFVAARVMEIRRRRRDDYYAALPVEVTLVGSSGVGCFETDQELATAFAVLNTIAASTPAFRTSLDGVVRFPDTDIFAFLFADESSLRSLHQKIVKSGLKFDASPWPYGPHCTLQSRSAVTDQDAASLLAERIPEAFELDQLSVYKLEDDPSGRLPVICQLLHRTWLRG